ncbi:MAG TPA: hypothetical protein VHT95_14090 [Vicinamibacterales bacterium]|jgi:hypothetical protein|nr:hypothetical protein [Vicinamibacterales bacterium]
MRLRVSGAVVLAIAGAVSISCGGITDPSQNTMTPISGTIAPGQARQHPFSVSQTGEIQVKLLTLTPASVPYLGMQWVQAAGDGTCTGNQLQVNFAPANTTAISAQIVSGNYCIIVYDPGNLTQTASYTGTISHP